jgi:predicted AlkP superfamily pyrophosphatase or phosphodiesterase
MHKNFLKCLVLLTAALWGLHPSVSVAQGQRVGAAQGLDRPKLILQLTVDQLRGDEPFRYLERFGEGGFRYLLNRGTWYMSAHHPHSHTVTAAGHTTLATGAYPSRHGMIADSWFDRDSGKIQDCVEDDRYKIVGTTDTGVSPMRIETTTFSDELTMTTARRAKIFAVSGKDRGAVPMAGSTGKAFWFSTANGDFVSSTYYYGGGYPAWVTGWNGQRRADRYANQSWTLLNPLSTYLFQNQPSFAPDVFGYGITFPHNFGVPSSGTYYQKLLVSPFVDRLTLEFALELIGREQLGADAVPDYLAISFSATDTIGHTFSPSSLESEDNMLRLDRTLAELFTYIDGRVGLENTLIVFAGDHGAPEVPEYLEELGVSTGRLEQKLIHETATQALKARYGRDDLILTYKHPYFYLDHAKVESAKLNEAELERVIAKAVMGLEGIAVAIASSDLRQGGEEADAEMIDQIRRNQYQKRSGDVYVVQESEWQVQDTPPSGERLSIIDHGTPWAYDSFVPVAFAGAKVPAARIARKVYTVDVAATLAVYLGTNTPSGSVGSPLVEVFDSGRVRRAAGAARRR